MFPCFDVSPLKAITSSNFQNFRGLGLACVAFGMISCGSDEKSTQRSGGKEAPRIEVAEVTAKPLGTSRTWRGTLEPLRTYEVVAPENGRVSAFRLDVGDEVSSGDVVVEMRFPDADARRGELAERVKHLETEKQRLTNLAESRAVSDAQVTSASISLLQARGELRGIEALLAEGMIRVPADGWVLETAAVVGSSVVEGAVLARMADASSMGVRFEVPNTEIHYFDEPGNLKARDGAGNAHAIGRIIRHGGARPNVTHVELWLVAEMGRGVGAVSVKYESSRDALCIPWSAVATDDDRSWVGLLDEDNRIVRREVSLGETSGTLVEVLDGLQKGDNVILYQPRSHGEGSRIKPVRRDETREIDE